MAITYAIYGFHFRQVAELGFYGLAIPEPYGGSGADLTTTCLVLEEIAKASPAFAGMLIGILLSMDSSWVRSRRVM